MSLDTTDTNGFGASPYPQRANYVYHEGKYQVII